ncbi:MAG: DUF2520 domain-containing protein [Muribaculaceae bacterium]|nr:DUF2520 domain-containing protein [Muribaculaceae bacterium]
MKIDIIGKGNVGTHLAIALKDVADVASVSSRTLEGLRNDSDIYLISVTDDVISDVASQVAGHIPCRATLAHTSGSTPLSAISGFHRFTGVFYPLQTFSKNVSLEYADIPFFIEGSDSNTHDILCETARLVSRSVYTADSEKRRDLHVASVLSCNFVNHLWALASGYLSQKELPFDALKPLIRETTRKIQAANPADVQTGPAVRHDMKTIEAHMSRLESDPELKEIYRLLTLSIIRTSNTCQN